MAEPHDIDRKQGAALEPQQGRVSPAVGWIAAILFGAVAGVIIGPLRYVVIDTTGVIPIGLFALATGFAAGFGAGKVGGAFFGSSGAGGVGAVLGSIVGFFSWIVCIELWQNGLGPMQAVSGALAATPGEVFSLWGVIELVIAWFAGSYFARSSGDRAMVGRFRR